MNTINRHRSSVWAAIVFLTSLMLFVSPAFSAEGSIDVIPDENVNGSVELTPGYIGGVVDIGGQVISRIDLTAAGGDYSAKANLSAEGAYELTVNVPKGDSLGYTLNGMAYMDNYNTRLYFKERSTVVDEAKISVVNVIIDAGYVVGQVAAEGCSVSQGELWAVLNTGDAYTRAYTKFGTDGSFRFPVQPNSNIRLYGQVQLSSGATYKLEDKYVDVQPSKDTVVGWDLTCGVGQASAIDHKVDYHFEMDYHYSYLYYQGAGSPYKTIRHDGQVLFDNIAPGDWRLYTYSYWNNGQNMIAKYLYDISAPAGETVIADIDTYPGFLQGNITLTGTHTLADTTAAHIYGYGKNSVYPSYRTTSRSRIDGADGAFNLALPHGEWDVYTSIYYFRNSDPGEAFLQSYLYMYDYQRRQDATFINADQTITGHDLSYETGSATIKYSRSDGGEFTRPFVYAKCYNYGDNNNLDQYIYSNSHGNPDGDKVTFVGFPGTYEVEAWAYVGSTQTTFGKVAIEILPGVDKIVDIGGPQLAVLTPAPNAVSDDSLIVVTGTATDESGVKDVIVNGTPAQLESTNNPDDENEVTFTIEVQLEEGDNSIETVAIDFSANESSDKRQVSYVIPEEIVVVETVVDVMVDIKPGSCKNPFNIKSKGVLPVVVLGSGDLSVADIDPASITLMGVAPLRSAVDDAATLEAIDPEQCQTDSPDGFDDLVLKFDTQTLVSVLGEVGDGDIITMSLAGAMVDGTEINGHDTITILKKGNQNTGKKK